MGEQSTHDMNQHITEKQVRDVVDMVARNKAGETKPQGPFVPDTNHEQYAAEALKGLQASTSVPLRDQVAGRNTDEQ